MRNLDTSKKEEITEFSVVNGKSIYERIESDKARYSYVFEYEDGTISQTYYYSVNIIKDEYVSKPSSMLCKNVVYNGKQQQITTITGNDSYKLSNYEQTNAGSYTITATLNKGYKWEDKTDTNITFNCSISKKDDVIEINAKSGEYTGNPISANEAVAESKSEITYKYYNSTNCSGDILESIPSSVGSYSVKAISKGNDNYNSGSKCVSHTIISKEMSTNSITLSEINYTYDGAVLKMENYVPIQHLV